jgi:hypothetical protein
VVPLTPASQPGPPTVICQGSVVFTDGCSTTFASSRVPAHPAMSGTKKRVGVLPTTKAILHHGRIVVDYQNRRAFYFGFWQPRVFKT